MTFAGIHHAMAIDFSNAQDASWIINKVDDRGLNGK